MGEDTVVNLDERDGVATQFGVATDQVERDHLIQRYSDAPPARLLVPTLAAFAASKTATWCDRAAARDLWDLWALPHSSASTDPPAGIPATTRLRNHRGTMSGNHSLPARPAWPSPQTTPSTPSAPPGRNSARTATATRAGT
ncbi:nucleotidyl transferase AbiEii/AbiGii toxin family protein [Rhodococcus sp. NPDC057529]|uniref:nucleotidyl transferase AbiEii/AbiGii toxin family protein n=1 Tax=Rhodococcus sp. NPDC057529 TaxID=3346158 RepID=UPI00366DB3F5